MRTSLFSRILRAVFRLLGAMFTAILLCLLLLHAADIVRCIGSLVSVLNGDAVLILGKWKFIFREELLALCRSKWDLLCRATETVIPAPLPQMADRLHELIAHAFSR